jgi:hypothetical protein
MFLLGQFGAILISYLVLYFAVPWFFKQPRPPVGTQQLKSIVYALLLIAGVCAIVFSIDSAFWSNRIQHAIGGGFVMMFVCFRAFQDARVRIDPLRFFIIAGMLVMTLGVASEIAEFFFQNVTDHVFADSIEDTWWDLLSNAVGAALGGAIFAPFISRKQ